MSVFSVVIYVFVLQFSVWGGTFFCTGALHFFVSSPAYFCNTSCVFSQGGNAHLLRVPWEHDSNPGRFPCGKTFDIALNRYYKQLPGREQQPSPPPGSIPGKRSANIITGTVYLHRPGHFSTIIHKRLPLIWYRRSKDIIRINLPLRRWSVRSSRPRR